MLSAGKRFLAANLTVLLLCPNARPLPRRSPPVRPLASFDTQALAAPTAWSRRVIFGNARTAARNTLSNFRLAYKTRRRIYSFNLGAAGLVSLLVFGHPYERWVASWADGSMRLTL